MTGENQTNETVRITDEMKDSYLDYAMSVTVGRAIPSAKDGLKPVQRRILYAMHENGVTSNKSHRKSSSVVGDVVGDYHPHGDSSVYEALVRMAQDFSLRHPLIDPEGNFGSMDGDPPAAMRYTECRLSKEGELMLKDLSEDTVEWSSNYTDRKKEPDYLPASFPNLLVNGSSGISVGISTSIPPHNMNEVIDATIEYIDKEGEITIEELMEHVKGPDFPTGGTIVNPEALENAYKTGEGRVRVRCDYDVLPEENRIVITEVPYKIDRKDLIQDIVDLVDSGRVEGIKDLRDESDRNGVRIVIDLKKSAIPRVVENQLVDKAFEKTQSMMLLALVDEEPTIMNLKSMIREYVEHRRDVLRRKKKSQLKELKKEGHILQGKIKIIKNSEEAIDVIRNSENREKAKTNLIQKYDLTEKQADHIVRLQIGTLTSSEVNELEEELKTKKKKIKKIKKILKSEKGIDKLVKKKLEDVKEKYGEERRTDIEQSSSNITKADLIEKEQSVIAITQKGYIKRIPQENLREQNRNGKGYTIMSLKEDDRLIDVEYGSSHDTYIILTDERKAYEIDGYEINKSTRRTRGDHIANIKPLDGNPVQVQRKTEGDYLAILTEQGKIKKTDLEEYEDIRRSGLIAINLKENDTIADTAIIEEGQKLIIESDQGKAIKFNEEEVSEVSRNSLGVNGIKLDEGKATTITPVTQEQLLTVTENGYGKRSSTEDYNKQARYGKGVKNIETGERNGLQVSSIITDGTGTVCIATETGKMIRTPIEQISNIKRGGKGVSVMDVEDEVTTITMIPENI